MADAKLTLTFGRPRGDALVLEAATGELELDDEERTSRIFGPYAHFSCVDGVAYVDGRIFAFYDEQAKDWYGFDDGRHWRRLVVCRAARRGP